MTDAAIASRPLHKRLGFRLAFAFAVALLPLGIVSALQSRSLLDEAKARSEAALLGETLLAVSPEVYLIRNAIVTSRSLATTVSMLADDTAKCQEAMATLVADADGIYTYAAFVPVSGMATCTSDKRPLDLTASPRLAAQRIAPKPDVVVISKGVASGTSVLAFGNPVLDSGGAYIGYVSLSMPHIVLEGQSTIYESRGNKLHDEPIALMIFDSDGNILTSTIGLEKAPDAVPASRSLSELTKNGAWTFSDYTDNGKDRIFAVFPFVENRLFAMGSWPNSPIEGPMSLLFSPFLMPGLMWFASLLVAVLAAERLVTRHIRTLRKSITAFASGAHRVADLEMSDAAMEIRDVSDAYLIMTDTILRDEAELEDMIHQREVLLREVHHRVKNNLQLIASIMNMQMRQSHSAEAKTLMKGLQDRVMSLATIHRGLYQTSGLADVRADELLSDILRQILKMSTGPGRRFDVTTQFDDIQLTPDQAVPLSLLLTEALTNAVKYAGADTGGAPKLAVSLSRKGATEAVLTVSNEIGQGTVPDPDAEASSGLGSQLMTAFTQQIGGRSSTTTDNNMYALIVQFPVRALSEAEVGRAPDRDQDKEAPDAV